MASVRTRGVVLRAVPFVLVVPLIVVPVVAYFALSAGGQAGLPVAQGAIGGAFHPVAGSFRPDTTTLPDCNGQYVCLEQAFGNLAFSSGPSRALAVFESRIDTDPIVAKDCHRIVHTIGSASYARLHGDIARTFSVGSSVCASGYYHGILERAFAGLTTKRELAAKAQSLCLGAGIRRRSFLDYQCRHGLGHGFMIQTGYDLPTALSLCTSLGTGWDEVTCTSGAFMENGVTRFGFRSRWLRDDDPLYPCNAIARGYRKSCYVRATTRILAVTENDFAKTAALCASLARTWASPCFRGFGRDAVVEAQYEDYGKALALCRLAGSYLDDCLLGAARTFSDGKARVGARSAAVFCSQAPRSARDGCAAGLGLIVGLLEPDDRQRRAACLRLMRAEADACSRSASAEVDPRGIQSWG